MAGTDVAAAAEQHRPFLSAPLGTGDCVSLGQHSMPGLHTMPSGAAAIAGEPTVVENRRTCAPCLRLLHTQVVSGPIPLDTYLRLTRTHHTLTFGCISTYAWFL
jgi:hypothetical protein